MDICWLIEYYIYYVVRANNSRCLKSILRTLEEEEYWSDDQARVSRG